MPEIALGHPLYGAELRLARARRLIGTMNRQYQQWAETQSAHGGFEQKSFDPQTGHLVVQPKLSDARFVYVPRIAITLGETAYNIRAALDYLVFSVAGASNNGNPVGGTQFPLEDDLDKYWGRWTGKHRKTGECVPRWLKKIPEEVAIDWEHYQPGAGCGWSALLRDISNPDKHRHLTTLSTTAAYRPPSLGGLTVIDAADGTKTVHFHGELEVGVFLPTGEDVIDASDLAQREARALIRSYAGRFQFPGPRFV